MSDADNPAVPPAGRGAGRGASRSAIAAWCFYDWANSIYTTVVITFVFANYFVKGVAADEVVGTSQWAWTIGISGIAIAVLSPIFGAIADHSGRRKPWLFVFTALAVVASAALWLTRPDISFVLYALVWVAIGNLAFELGMVFYNAMLPDLAPKAMIGRISGWGWGVGYVGGLVGLVVVLVGFVLPETPWFGLDKATAEHLRATNLLVALWFAVFALPLFLLTPDIPPTGLSTGQAVRTGLRTLGQTIRGLGGYRDIVMFLVARLFYNDGMVTLFAVGGIYAAGTFGFEFRDIIVFGIAINVTAGLGAAVFGWIDDWIGPKRTILNSLACLTVVAAIVLVIESKTLFWVFGVTLGLFVGPVQAASRSMMAHLAPDHMQTEMFGLFAFSGKSTAWAGPIVLGTVTAMFASQRAGMATILVFFIVGGVLLLRVKEPAR
jgi:UMF1 family MFS transporter